MRNFNQGKKLKPGGELTHTITSRDFPVVSQTWVLYYSAQLQEAEVEVILRDLRRVDAPGNKGGCMKDAFDASAMPGTYHVPGPQEPAQTVSSWKKTPGTDPG